jgi:thymidylate synthase
VSANVVRSAPCGSTWFVAKKMLGLEPDQPDLRERISEAHHSCPCTGSMVRDIELGDAVLHIGGYIIREATENALSKGKKLD